MRAFYWHGLTTGRGLALDRLTVIDFHLPGSQRLENGACGMRGALVQREASAEACITYDLALDDSFKKKFKTSEIITRIY